MNFMQLLPLIITSIQGVETLFAGQASSGAQKKAAVTGMVSTALQAVGQPVQTEVVGAAIDTAVGVLNHLGAFQHSGT